MPRDIGRVPAPLLCATSLRRASRQAGKLYEAGNRPTDGTAAGTDWPRVKRVAARDARVPTAADDSYDPYDPNDVAVVSAHWQAASIERGRGRPAGQTKRPTLNKRIDAAVLEALKATGPGWQTRINALFADAVKRGLADAVRRG